jgi:ABC-type glycerol-3-phosphate transport system substrate-binding protein
MKKVSLLMFPLILASLAGCNGGGNNNTGKVVINFWHTFGQKPEAALKSKIADFVKKVKDKEGVDVEVVLSYQGGYKDMPSKVTTGIATGESPTIAIAYADHVADYLALEGEEPGKYVVNFDKFLKDSAVTFGTEADYGDTMPESDMVKSYLDEGRSLQREGTYLIPLMKSTEIMTYNLDAAKAAMAYAYPDVPVDRVQEFMKTITWEQLLNIARAAVEHKDTISSKLEYPIYYDSDSNLFITELYQNDIGYSSIGTDGKGRVDFEESANLTKAKEIVSALKKAHDDGLLTTQGVEGTYASNSFKEAKTLFSIGSTGGTGYTIPDAGQFDTAFAKVPTMGEKVAYISQGPSVCMLNNTSLSKAENDNALKYGWKLIKYLTSKQVNVSLCVNGSEGYSPVRESCYTTETYSDFIEGGEGYAEAALVTQNDIAGRYYNSAVFPGSATLRKEVGSLVTNVLNGKSTLDDAFATAINNAKKDIK